MQQHLTRTWNGKDFRRLLAGRMHTVSLQQASQLGDVSTEWVVLKVVSGTCKIYNCRDLMPRVVERSSSE